MFMGQGKLSPRSLASYLCYAMKHRESGRHLAVILFTDIVGYTSMMQRDEATALQAVRRYQQVAEQLIPHYEGEIYQFYGDGSMSIFTSAIQAVSCALAIQQELQQAPTVPLKVGMHIGEIYNEGGKIFGDGVNVASRIESIGQGGTILFSRDVYEKIRNHSKFQARSIGKFEFKNVDDPVEVFALTNEGIVFPDLKAVEGKLKEQAQKKKWPVTYFMGIMLLLSLAGYFVAFQSNRRASDEAIQARSIAVLPFKNLNSADSTDFLGVGLAEDILTQLAQIKDLKVISRSSSIRYKNSDKPIRKIASELGVKCILEGSVRQSNDMLRVSVQLTDASNESLIWAADFDRQFEDVLNVQRDVALAVCEKLKIALSEELESQLKNHTHVNPNAYVLYQKGQEKLLRNSGSTKEIQEAKALFEASLREDSTFSLAWIGLADAWIEMLFWHRVQDEDALPQAKAAAMRALALNPNNGESYGVLGAINLMERDLVSAKKNLDRSIELSPSYSFAYERLAWLAIFKGEYDRALDLYKTVIQLDPLSTRIKGSLGSSYAFMGRYKEGIQQMQVFLQLHPGDNFLLWSLAYCQAANGDYADAIKSLDKRTIGTGTNWIYAYCYAKLGRTADAQRILDYHIERSKRDHVPDFMMAIQYLSLGHTQEALEFLEQSIHTEGENWFILGISSDPMLKPLHGHPEFERLIDELKVLYGLR
jgi:adenylate cyclase